MLTETDVLIAGGGLVGASLAVALGQTGLRVCVVEATAFSRTEQSTYDERSIALAQGSQRIFAAMGLWDKLAEQVCPIHTIHVSDRGRFAFTRLRREQEGVEALGYVASARVLGNALQQQIEANSNIRVLAPARMLDYAYSGDCLTASIEQDGGVVTELKARLLVAADGAQSIIREQASINTLQRPYGQTAIVANVTPELAHDYVAYERFTNTGPMALLPMTGQRCALVWTVLTDQADDIMALDDAEFLARLQQRFGYRLGRFEKVGQRYAYPLQLLRASETVRERVALIGNAIHTLHPIAGQGFNLGLRDVAVLAEVIVDAQRSNEDIGARQVLQQYAKWRQGDQRRVVTFTDSMVRIFTQPFPPVAWIRDAGMLAMDFCPPAKRWFGRLTMGRAGKLPRLARGLEL